jgi:hypothetical protein
MLKNAVSPLFVIFANLSLALASQGQSNPPRSASKPVSDACSGPWHQIGFDGFKVGMRLPGMMKRLPWSRCTRDKYRRKTSANEYEIQPFYSNDDTESRLHPATVLATVNVNIDQPRPVAELFSDLTEIAQLCAGGCRIVGLSPNENPKFALFPKNPTDEQRASALRAARHMLPQDRPDNPLPVIYFYWEQKQYCPHFDDGSLDWPIVRAEFSVADTSFPHQSRRPRQHTFGTGSYMCNEREPGFTDLGDLGP